MPKRQQKGKMEKKNAETPLSQPAEELLTVHEVARCQQVHDATIHQWMSNGTLDAIALPHLGKHRRYRVKSMTLDKLLGNPMLASHFAPQ